ncbi:hypothetical protein [Sinomonas sp.]|uniref:hypothetical protein n=1 Tax=Sinomonas sp. TaxID=1914986 RepID=UPI002BFD8519|nr:hypothetical protein [Sinomonas sp.]
MDGPLVLLDDVGALRLYASEAELAESGEDPGSTRCVIGRHGEYFHLLADPDARGLRVSRQIGMIAHETLWEHLRRQREVAPELHRILRRFPESREDFLAELFEELSLEAPGDQRAWTVSSQGQVWHCQGLDGVDRVVAQRAGVPDGKVVVRDPYGHAYVPRVVKHGSLARRLRGRPLYVEVVGQE